MVYARQLPPGKGYRPAWRAGAVLATLRPPVALAFHHLAVQCADLARSERFYREVLGLEVLTRWPREGGGDRSVWLRVGGGGFLALERAGAAPDPTPFRHPTAGLHLFALRIAPGEREGWEARLRAHGVPVVHRTAFTIYVRDPEGNRVGLSHHPEAAPGGAPGPSPGPAAPE